MVRRIVRYSERIICPTEHSCSDNVTLVWECRLYDLHEGRVCAGVNKTQIVVGICRDCSQTVKGCGSNCHCYCLGVTYNCQRSCIVEARSLYGLSDCRFTIRKWCNCNIKTGIDRTEGWSHSEVMEDIIWLAIICNSVGCVTRV